MSNLVLIGHKKRFLSCSVGAPGRTHDARLLRNTKIYRGILAGEILPKKGIDLGEMGKIPQVTTADSAVVCTYIHTYKRSNAAAF